VIRVPFYQARLYDDSRTKFGLSSRQAALSERSGRSTTQAVASNAHSGGEIAVGMNAGNGMRLIERDGVWHGASFGFGFGPVRTVLLHRQGVPEGSRRE
jgi:hypothetical protein